MKKPTIKLLDSFGEFQEINFFDLKKSSKVFKSLKELKDFQFSQDPHCWKTYRVADQFFLEYWI